MTCKMQNLTHVDLQTLEPQSAAAEERLGQPISSHGPAQMPPMPPSTVVEIGPNDDPQQMPQMTPLISDSVARLVGGPFQAPTGNPNLITKNDYLALIKHYPGETYYLTTYATYNTISLNAYEVVSVLAAFWQASGDPKYLDALVKAVNNFAAAIMAETAAQASSGDSPLLSTYRRSEYAWVYLGLRVFSGAHRAPRSCRRLPPASPTGPRCGRSPRSRWTWPGHRPLTSRTNSGGPGCEGHGMEKRLPYMPFVL